MKASETAYNLIKKFEGCRLEAYKCQAGVCTIGYGHTEGVKPETKITQEEAEQFLSNDIKKAEKAIEKQVKVELTQNQYDALISFIYNVGAEAFRHSTLLYKLNNNEIKAIPKELKKWVFIKAVRSKGLMKRRNAEADLFEKE